MEKGKIVPNGVLLQLHEYATIILLTDLGYDVELIKPIQIKGIRTPDIIMDGLKWEIKAPIGNGKYTLEHSFRAALKQSVNIIFDVRHSKMEQAKVIAELERRFYDFKKVKRMLIMTKQRKLLEYLKQD